MTSGQTKFGGSVTDVQQLAPPLATRPLPNRESVAEVCRAAGRSDANRRRRAAMQPDRDAYMSGVRSAASFDFSSDDIGSLTATRT